MVHTRCTIHFIFACTEWKFKVHCVLKWLVISIFAHHIVSTTISCINHFTDAKRAHHGNVVSVMFLMSISAFNANPVCILAASGAVGTLAIREACQELKGCQFESRVNRNNLLGIELAKGGLLVSNPRCHCLPLYPWPRQQQLPVAHRSIPPHLSKTCMCVFRRGWVKLVCNLPIKWS